MRRVAATAIARCLVPLAVAGCAGMAAGAGGAEDGQARACRRLPPTSYGVCMLLTSGYRDEFLPEAGRGADLPTQVRCHPDRGNAAAYAACLADAPPEPAARPVPRPAKAAAGGAVGARVPERPAARSTGGFGVQVAAVRGPAEAEAAWRELRGRHPSLAGLGPRAPRRAEVAGLGVVYRVVAGSFATRAEARAACERLRAEGGECRVRAP